MCVCVARVCVCACVRVWTNSRLNLPTGLSSNILSKYALTTILFKSKNDLFSLYGILVTFAEMLSFFSFYELPCHLNVLICMRLFSVSTHRFEGILSSKARSVVLSLSQGTSTFTTVAISGSHWVLFFSFMSGRCSRPWFLSSEIKVD